MAYRIRYRRLAVVSIHHGFHLNRGRNAFDDLDDADRQRKLAGYDIFEDLRLQVPDDTRRTLDGLGLLLKQTPTGIIVGSPVEEPSPGVFVPSRVPRQPFRIRLALIAHKPDFWNYTNLDLIPGERGSYYLSNRVGANGGRFPYLSAPPGVYAAGEQFAAGEVVRPSEQSPDRFLAIRSGAHASPLAGDGDPPSWLPLGQRDYVNATDRLALRPQRFRHPIAAASLASATAALIGADGSIHPVGAATASPGAALEQIAIDASARAPGRYRLHITGTTTSDDPFDATAELYIDSALAASGAFAIIELFHDPDAGLGDYRLYDEADDLRLLEPHYRIELLNRHTFWRYRFASPPAADGDLGDLELDDDGQFVTRRIMPLTRGVERVLLGSDTFLPNPTGGPIVPEADRMYSDIHVHLT